MKHFNSMRDKLLASGNILTRFDSIHTLFADSEAVEMDSIEGKNSHELWSKMRRIARKLATTLDDKVHIDGDVEFHLHPKFKLKGSQGGVFSPLTLDLDDGQVLTALFRNIRKSGDKVNPRTPAKVFAWYLNREDITHYIYKGGNTDIDNAELTKRLTLIVNKMHSKFIAKNPISAKSRIDAMDIDLSNVVYVQKTQQELEKLLQEAEHIADMNIDAIDIDNPHAIPLELRNLLTTDDETNSEIIKAYTNKIDLYLIEEFHQAVVAAKKEVLPKDEQMDFKIMRKKYGMTMESLLSGDKLDIPFTTPIADIKGMIEEFVLDGYNKKRLKELSEIADKKGYSIELDNEDFNIYDDGGNPIYSHSNSLVIEDKLDELPNLRDIKPTDTEYNDRFVALYKILGVDPDVLRNHSMVVEDRYTNFFGVADKGESVEEYARKIKESQTFYDYAKQSNLKELQEVAEPLGYTVDLVSGQYTIYKDGREVYSDKHADLAHEFLTAPTTTDRPSDQELIAKIKEHEVYKQLMKDSSGGMVYDVAKAGSYDANEILNLWEKVKFKDLQDGILKGAMNWLLEYNPRTEGLSEDEQYEIDMREELKEKQAQLNEEAKALGLDPTKLGTDIKASSQGLIIQPTYENITIEYGRVKGKAYVSILDEDASQIKQEMQKINAISMQLKSIAEAVGVEPKPTPNVINGISSSLAMLISIDLGHEKGYTRSAFSGSITNKLKTKVKNGDKQAVIETVDYIEAVSDWAMKAQGLKKPIFSKASSIWAMRRDASKDDNPSELEEFLTLTDSESDLDKADEILERLETKMEANPSEELTNIYNKMNEHLNTLV